MMIEKIRNKIIENVGVKHKFRFNGARNQIEEFDGVISKTYPAIFTILSDDNVIKSFSYSDVLTNNIEIIE